MKKVQIVIIAIACVFVLAGCISSKKYKQKPGNDGFCPTYSYEGSFTNDKGEKVNITLNMMRLLDSTLICSYYLDTAPSIVYRMVGHLFADRTFVITEWEGDSATFSWQGTQSEDGKRLCGERVAVDGDRKYVFAVDVVFGKSYWDYIRKNRGYEEYTDLAQALKHCHEVLSIDVANQGLTRLPDDLAKLDRIESINLLGNRIDTFPSVLAEMVTLDEISLSSNGMKYIGPEIGQLKNLRILIMNRNGLKALPKEIGELTNLLYLEIGENPITSLPPEIRNLTKLQELHIDNWQPSSERFTEEQKMQIQEWLPNCKIFFDKNQPSYARPK